MNEKTVDSSSEKEGVKNIYRLGAKIFGVIGVIGCALVVGFYSLKHYNERHYREYQTMISLQKLAQAEESLEKHLATNPDDHRARYELIKALYKRGNPERANGIAAILMEQQLEIQLQYDLPNHVWGQNEEKIVNVHERVKSSAFRENYDADSLLEQLSEIQKDIDLLAAAGDMLTNYWKSFDLASNRNQEATQHLKAQEAIKSFISFRRNRIDFEKVQYLNCGAIFGEPFGGSSRFNLVSLINDYADLNIEKNEYSVASYSYEVSSALVETNLICFDSHAGDIGGAEKLRYQSLTKELQFKRALSEHKAERFDVAIAVLRQLKADGYEDDSVSNLIDESLANSALQHLNGLQQEANKAFNRRDWQGALAVYQEIINFSRQQKSAIFEKEEARAIYNMAICYGNAEDDVKQRQLLRQLQRHFPEWEPELVSARLRR